jgi:hypothetical protein
MIIVLSGKARSGKDTAAQILKDWYIKNNKSVNVVAYADLLKQVIGKCFMLWEPHLYGDLKEVPITRLPKNTQDPLQPEFWTPRELFQYIGTDVFRKIHPDCWVNPVKSEALFGSKYQHTIITDGRFMNEIGWVLSDCSYGIHIHINKESRDAITNSEHLSENSLSEFDEHPRRFIIDNNSTLQDLNNKLINIITSLEV